MRTVIITIGLTNGRRVAHTVDTDRGADLVLADVVDCVRRGSDLPFISFSYRGSVAYVRPSEIVSIHANEVVS